MFGHFTTLCMKGLNQQNGIIRDSKIATPVILTKFIDE